MTGKLARIAAIGAAIVLAGPLLAPQLLAFPHYRESNGGRVWSVEPIDPDALDAVTSRANDLIAKSPIATSDESRDIFLTDGGWRWLWLSAPSNSGAFALTRPLGETIVLNRSDIVRDSVERGAAVGGKRALSAVIAHETAHGMIRRRYGFVKAALAPQWLVEGYADHVAQESSLSDADYLRLKKTGERHPAMPYYEGRKRVEAALDRNGGDVDALFAGE